MPADITLRKAASSGCVPASLLSLYEQSFPYDERRPEEDILAKVDGLEPRYAFYIVEADGAEAGMMTAWTFPEYCYVEHFATHPALRGKGVGAKALKLLASMHRRPLLVEVELPQAAPMAQRRIEFYRRCGFKELPYSYVQPPYTPTGRPVKLMLMATEPIADPGATLHTEVYGIGN